MSIQLHDTHWRTFVKALSYRAVSTVVTGAVAWFATGELPTALAIAAGDSLLKVGLFYAHERAWTRIRFGQARPPEYEI